MNSELLRLVDSIHRDKDVDKEVIFDALELAMLSAARKQYGMHLELVVDISRDSGEIKVFDGEEEIEVMTLGRISAQTAKQIIIQRIREAERDVIFHDYERRTGEIVNGVIQRFEGPNIIVNLGKTEGFLTKREQARGENYRTGERVRALVLEVRKAGPKVRISLSRTHPDLIRRLFELEVPEISDRTIEIKALARESGARSKIAVFSIDSKVDCVGACVGVRGTRIKNIVDELNGEKIDIVRWSDSVDVFIANALRPAEINSIHMDSNRKRAVVIVPEDQLALGIGKRGQNVRLAAKLVNWNIDIFTSVEFEAMKDQAKIDFADLPNIEDRIAAKMVASGIYSLNEFADSEPEFITQFDGINEEDVDSLQDAAIKLIRKRREEFAAKKAAEEAKAAEVATTATESKESEENTKDTITADPAVLEESKPEDSDPNITSVETTNATSSENESEETSKEIATSELKEPDIDATSADIVETKSKELEPEESTKEIEADEPVAQEKDSNEEKIESIETDEPSIDSSDDSNSLKEIANRPSEDQSTSSEAITNELNVNEDAKSSNSNDD